MRKLLLGLLSVGYATCAHADETRGVVVYDKGCGSRVVIETAQGYVLAAWQDGSPPSKGETLVGDLNEYGVKKVYNVNTDGGGSLRIEGYGLSAKRAAEQLKSKCR
jgi:hypothetical protein